MKIKFLAVATALLGVLTGVAQNRTLPVDTAVTTQHSVTVNGTNFSYTAKTGTQPVWDELGKPMAALHYTY